MTLKILSIKKSLRKKGFVENKSRNHIFYYFYYQGKKTKYRTMVSHSGEDAGDALIGLMAKQLCLSKNQFFELVSCTISKDDIERIYCEKGV